MEAIEQITEKIKAKQSFVLEAGAGSGKTYALIQTINYLLNEKGTSLLLSNQKIVCITYTNVAKNEIIERLENNPLVLVSTIHEFLWDCIKPYNKQLLIEFDSLNTKYQGEKPEKYELGLIDRIKSVEYTDRTFSDFEQGIVGHDDLITLAKMLFENHTLLTKILASKYPYILVDEYQDTASETIQSLLDFLLLRNKEVVIIGFYGDSHQKIYNTGVGSLQSYVDAKTIQYLTKVENYRSSKNVVRLLNNVRANIQQIIPNDIERIDGSIEFVNCTNYPDKGNGQKVKEYENSLIDQKNKNYESVVSDLEKKGWGFGYGSDDKILIIANSRVAQRGGFGNLYSVYAKRFSQGAAEALIKREHPLTALFVGSVDKKTSIERKTGIEHLISFYSEGSYNEIHNFLKKNGNQAINLKKHKDKEIIVRIIEELIELRKSKKIREVLEFTLENKLISLSTGVTKLIERINTNPSTLDNEQKEKIEREKTFYNNLMELTYTEITSLFEYTQKQNVFSTKHGTKGEEYRNVLVVIDDTSWKSQYKFEGYFDNTDTSEERKERTKNLFYVSCSRAKEKLVVLALSKMGDSAMKTVNDWFGSDNVRII